jgi:hypothetical protein
MENILSIYRWWMDHGIVHEASVLLGLEHNCIHHMKEYVEGAIIEYLRDRIETLMIIIIARSGLLLFNLLFPIY